jgi:DNA-binding LacI/PurR family transcriptional regulator
MPKRVTLKDVAKRAGVSYQTVSKVLRGQIQVTPEVRARIEAAAEELNYRPNITARNLRERSSHLIGYSWKPTPANQVNFILDEFQQSIVAAAERAGYHILLFPHRDNVDIREPARIGRVDGFILSDLNYDDPRIPLLQELNFPFVAFGRSNEEWVFPYVDVDCRAGLRQATEHLISQGHQRIAILAWPENSRVGTARLNGYLEAMNAAGLKIDPAWIVRREGGYEYGYQATLELLNLPEERRPTAIATLVDEMAIGAMRAIKENGFVVGRDVAVTGFDDTPVAQYLEPGLTSLRQPVWEVGQHAVNLLVNLLKRETSEVQQILIPPQLIVRGSSQGFHPA